MMYPLTSDGVFWSIQGEGALRGLPMTFIRLAGCSMRCANCDTDYRVKERVSVDEILSRVLLTQKLPSRIESPRWVWLTGGEPTEHDLVPLVDGLHAIRCSVALATSGVRSVRGLGSFGFISVSPHDEGQWVQRSGTEIKVVPGLSNSITVEDVLPYGSEFHYRYLQPLAGDTASLAFCRDWVLNHPDWQLSDQGHKQWGLP